MTIFERWINNPQNAKYISKKNFTTPAELNPFVEAVADAGGDALLVGGCVRDFLLGLKPKDYDYLVFGIGVEDLQTILENKAIELYGELQDGQLYVNFQGAKFGVLVIRINGEDYEFATCRLEKKCGEGRTGFEIVLDPNMTPIKEAERRDLTINAMSYCSRRGIMIDCFEGQEDLQNGVLRHTTVKFAEDVSRVFRCVSQAARFRFDLNSQTAVFCSGLKGEFDKIHKDDMWRIWLSYFQKSQQFSKGMDVLIQSDWITFFPELQSFVENDRYQDWCSLLDNGADLGRALKLNEYEFSLLILSILTYSFDSEDQLSFMKRINVSTKRIKAVIQVVRTSKWLESVYGSPNFVGFFDQTTLKNLIHECPNNNGYLEILNLLVGVLTFGKFPLKTIKEQCDQYGISFDFFKPILNGEVLKKEFGFTDGQALGKACQTAKKAELEGIFHSFDSAKNWAHVNL
ncbi:MAG: hypothetical protein ACRCXZ_05420 [Patescibacteria group bacterium]